LIFADDCGVGDALIKKFTERGGEIICVRTGYRFMEESPFSYRINPGKEKEYKDLFERLFKHNLLPECIIHGWGITGSKEHELAETPSFALFYSLSAIVKAYLCKKLVLLTNDLHPVLDSEEIPYDKSLAPALLKVLSHEFPAVCTSHIDISLTDAMRDRLSDDLYSEILGGTAGKVISLRHGVRWEQFYDKVATDNIRNGNQSLREGGVYLITGGLGAVGSAIAAWLLKNQKAKVIVSGRTKLPVPEEQDTWLKSEWIATEVKTKIRRLQMLEKHGKVIYLEGNIADAARMEQLVKISEEIFGSITGVIHTAGIKSGSSINSVTALGKADFESQFEPKIAGLKVLKDIFGSKELNFCLLTSTIAAVTGGIGFGAYGPANSFMDYYIKAHRRLGELNNWVSVNFDGFDLEQNDAAGIRDSELPDMLSRILAATDYAQIVVSTTDLQKRLDRQAGRDASSDEVPTDVASEDDAIETTLLRLWRKLFGKPDMTPDDDYFEAGGDSLKALTLIGRIRDLHTVEVSIKEFFSRPTIRGLSEYIRSVKQADMPDLDADLIAATIRTHKGSPTNFEVI
jgi:polyketide synthase PksN